MAEINKYANGKIYKITDVGYTKCYIGSTVQPLSERMASHRRDFKRFEAGKRDFLSSFALFQEFGLENCKIELVEEFACENRDQLVKKEGEHIKSNDCVNKNLAGRTYQEWRADNSNILRDKTKAYCEANADKIKERKHKYFQEHKEEIRNKKLDWYKQNIDSILKKKKEYYKNNIQEIQEKGKEYRKINKIEIQNRKQKYYEENKEKIQQHEQEYYNENKAAILEKAKQHYERNKEQKLEYQKKYYKTNQDKRNAYNKQYNAINSEKLKEKGREQIVCPICTATMCRNSLPRHQRSKTCLNASLTRKKS